ncbi:helix-turn-helix transcriptional regulator [Parasphingorhabdus sp.]|uniref:helix-turn-helix transcriptional regulator n=1 Tax=Parasphingorhabdus sp. TaxID=2709688 RepID=UPI003A9050CA
MTRGKTGLQIFLSIFFAKLTYIIYEREMTSTPFDDLNENEKEALHLLLQGYDAKTAAQVCGVTPNVINERLRSSRQKLQVTSSKAAARMLAEHERIGPKFFVPKEFGIDEKPKSGAIYPLPGQQAASPERDRVREMQATYQSYAASSSPLLSVPLRKQGERVNGLSKGARIWAIADLSVKLAFAFAFVCLAAMLVSRLIAPN